MKLLELIFFEEVLRGCAAIRSGSEMPHFSRRLPAHPLLSEALLPAILTYLPLRSDPAPLLTLFIHSISECHGA